MTTAEVEKRDGHAKEEFPQKNPSSTPKVQWTLSLRIVLHFFIFVCAGVVFGLIKQGLTNPFNGMKANLMTFWNQSGPMVLALACLMPIFIRDTLTLSNRIAGPIHNLRNKCRELADGVHDVTPLKFRKHDIWDDLPELFNRMMQQVNKGEASLSTSAVVTETEKLPESVGV